MILEVTDMIWIECDCCGRTLAKHESYCKCVTTTYGPNIVSLSHMSHICEDCYRKIRKAVEVVKHDA